MSERSLVQLAADVIAACDPDEARELADRMLAANAPPVSFSQFLRRVPGVPATVPCELFNVLCDAFDQARWERKLVEDLVRRI